MCRVNPREMAGSCSPTRTAQAPNVSLDQVPEDRLPATGELSRVHLDLYTADQPAEDERLLRLGATRHDREYGPDDDFLVHVDPDGNRFCVIANPMSRTASSRDIRARLRQATLRPA